MNKFDELYNKIIMEMKSNLPSNIEIIEDVIQDEFIPEGFKFKADWKDYLPKMEEYILDTIKYSNKFNEKDTIGSIDYGDLAELVKEAFDNFDLVVEISDPEDEDDEDNED